MSQLVHARSILAASLGALVIVAATLLMGSRGSADPSTPGGALFWGPVTVTDNSSGTVYNFAIRANEDDFVAGKGSVAMELGGPSLSLCTVHVTGPLFVDFSTNPETGSFPYQNVQCGRAFGQTVAIDGCVATIKAHAFVHSDDPNVNVLDGMILSVRLQKTGASTANFDATISTVGRKIEVHGKATAPSPIGMPTCP